MIRESRIVSSSTSSLNAPWLVKNRSFIGKSSRRTRRPVSRIARDALLVCIAVLVIALSFSPEPPHRQLVWYRGPSGAAERYSLSVDDPRLPKLHEQLHAWHDRQPADTLGVTRWQRETAQLYAKQLANDPTPVAQVSFELPSRVEFVPAQAAAKNGPDTQRYWLAVSERCEQILEKQAEELERHVRERGAPPIAFGKVVAPGTGPRTLGICLVWGLLAALVFSVWSVLSPTMELVRRDAAEVPREAAGSTDLRFVIPSHWIRIHQPVSVRIRQCTYAAVVLWALCCGLV